MECKETIGLEYLLSDIIVIGFAMKSEGLSSLQGVCDVNTPCAHTLTHHHCKLEK